MSRNGLINLSVTFSAQGRLLPLLFILVVIIILFMPSCTEKPDTPSPLPSTEGPDHSSAGVDRDIERLRQTVTKEPGNINARIELGNLLMDAGRFSEAIDIYEEIIGMDPENVDVRVDLGTCYRNSGEPERAVEEYKKALRYDPKNLYAHRNLGIVLAYDLGRTREAIAELEAYLRLSPDAPDALQVKEAIKELRERS